MILDGSVWLWLDLEGKVSFFGIGGRDVCIK